MYLLRQTTTSSLFIIPFQIVFMRNGFASSTRTLRFFQVTMHPSDTTKMTSLHHFILCILINGCLKSLSISVMTTTMSTRMVSTHEVSTWPSYTFFFNLNAIQCNCSVALWVKINFMSLHSNPAVRTPNVNYGQFSLFLEIAISSLNSIALIPLVVNVCVPRTLCRSNQQI